MVIIIPIIAISFFVFEIGEKQDLKCCGIRIDRFQCRKRKIDGKQFVAVIQLALKRFILDVVAVTCRNISCRNDLMVIGFSCVFADFVGYTVYDDLGNWNRNRLSQFFASPDLSRNRLT